MADDKESKTEDATERQVTKAREQGRVAKSAEMNTFAVLLVSLLIFVFSGMSFMEKIKLFWREAFMASGTYVMTVDSMYHLLTLVSKQMFAILAPILLVIAVAGVIVNLWQNDGWLFTWEPLMPKLDKLNPLTGWSRFASKEGLMTLVKSLAKIGVVGITAYLAIYDQWEKVPTLMELPVEQTLQFLGDGTFTLFRKVLLILFLIAIADYAYQKYEYKENLKMSKQEVKDERKDMEGDPRIKARIRQRQFEMFRRRMMSEVPKAEVIITNPTHLSIALRYDRMIDAAPICVAKGAGHIALKIREIAKEHDIPIVEDKPLAQTLFKTVDMGDAIPETMYKAVAQILAYVYRIKQKAM